MGNSNQNINQVQNHPHYENIYESIEQYNAAANGGAVIGAAALINASSANVPAGGHRGLQQQPSHDGNILHQHQSAQQYQRLLGKITYRNEPCDRLNIGSNVHLNAGNRDNNYDIPKSARSGLGFRRNFQMDLHAVNPRFNALRCNGIGCSHASSYCQRPPMFDDAESQHYYNLYNYHSSSGIRCENVYEQIHDEPIYRNVNGNGMYGRLNVIGHGIGRIERHLSSSCGNIDHYNLGGHYAVLGHSHFGTMGHIRLNNNNLPAISNASMPSTKSNQHNSTTINANGNSALMKDKEANNVKISSSSFFSCLHGESTQSMSNIYKATTQTEQTTNTSSVNNTSIALGTSTNRPLVNTAIISNSSIANANTEMSNSSTNAASKLTGAIPKIRALNLGSAKSSNSNIFTADKPFGTILKNGSNRKTSGSTPVVTNTNKTTSSVTSVTSSAICNAVTESQHDNGNNNSNSLNRSSKSNLHWLLVNKWLPLWMGQGTDCKVIDFNFMFSRDCIDCDTYAAAGHFSNPYAISHLNALPQDIVRFNATAAMCCPSPISPIDTLRRQPITHFNNRNLRSTFQRFHETHSVSSQQYFEDPSYENIYVHWRNGFEFARSRETDYQQRSHIQGAHSESPMFQQKNYNNHASANTQLRCLRNQSSFPTRDFSTCDANKFSDPYRSYELNSENNSFKPKQIKTDGIEPTSSDININNKPIALANYVNSGNVAGGSQLIDIAEPQIQADIPLIPLNPIESSKTETAVANVIIINNSNQNDAPVSMNGNNGGIIGNSSSEGSSSSSSNNNDTFNTPDTGNNSKTHVKKDQNET